MFQPYSLRKFVCSRGLKRVLTGIKCTQSGRKGIQTRCLSIGGVEIPSHKVLPPCRALLYVPGHDQRKLDKIPSLNVDCVTLDCEDGVALEKKEEARLTIVQKYHAIKTKFKGELSVRVNAPCSTYASDDFKALSLTAKYPTTIVVPKVNEIDEIKWVCSNIMDGNRGHNLVRIIFQTETAIGLLNLREIIEAGIAACAVRAPKCHISGVIFGSDDFCADLQIRRTEDAQELMYARQKIVATTRAYGLQAIDMVYIDYKDNDGLRKQAKAGADMGFSGKQVIHPSQIPIVQDCFSPSKEQIEWADELMKAFEESKAGAFSFRGQMIDMPTILQAKNIQRIHRAICQS